jgi:restriction endonuclease Mrr
MKLKSPRKVRQQGRVVLLALYIFKNYHGQSRPEKRKVLRFIQSQGLMHVPVEDKDVRSSGDAIWQNDLAWKREDLKEQGLLRMPEHGIWQITEYGETEVREWAKRIKEMTNERPNWVADFKAHSDPTAEFDDEFHYEFYITEETVRWHLKLRRTERSHIRQELDRTTEMSLEDLKLEETLVDRTPLLPLSLQRQT